ncbi:hypothetical protein [Blastococcus sp. CT_GayMR16]|uniref:hypothetical protein n=1 Tax=Blastococcus sp. CT_GayMR16 TaxID=2559607 RepID=UPI001073F8D3|nr:hypothetical protein [Blastococcus sp. CT_GayMR16]TFV90404.1 hypothetical protein E4P38_02895 [Blastococcus sp. CT_GayMR16]
MTRGRRPSIFQIGQIRDDGTTVTVSGWGLGLCADNCNCHRHPVGRHLTLFEDTATGSLGLVRHGGPCACCQPWTYAELEAVLQDLADVAALMAEA